MEQVAGETADSKVYFKDKSIDHLRSGFRVFDIIVAITFKFLTKKSFQLSFTYVLNILYSLVVLFKKNLK